MLHNLNELQKFAISQKPMILIEGTRMTNELVTFQTNEPKLFCDLVSNTTKLKLGPNNIDSLEAVEKFTKLDTLNIS